MSLGAASYWAIVSYTQYKTAKQPRNHCYIFYIIMSANWLHYQVNCWTEIPTFYHLYAPLNLFIIFWSNISFSFLTMEATAKYDYDATADDELSFRKGELLKVR